MESKELTKSELIVVETESRLVVARGGGWERPEQTLKLGGWE